jgi:hypothetical protein
MGRQYTIQVTLSERQAEHLLNLIEDELDVAEADAVDRKALEASASHIKSALQRLDARRERLS